ncbi:MAG: DNA alkylation repair protein [Terriglobia bacterium]
MRTVDFINNLEIAAEEFSERIFLLESFTTEAIRALRREFSKRVAKSPARFVVEVALRLMDKHTMEHRFVAYELVCHHRAALASLTEKDIKLFSAGIGSWGSVDMFACYLAGPAWREHQVPDKLIHRWARSRNRWFRRAALVSTVPLNNKARGGRGDTARTLEVCASLVGDRDDMVVKALSWALRELSKRDPEAVGQFLDEHQSALAARVVREVRTKLSTGLKNPRLRNGGKVR